MGLPLPSAVHPRYAVTLLLTVPAMDLASIYFGLFLGVFVFTFAKAVEQTRSIWKHTHRIVHPYLFMIWVEAWVNFVFCIVTYLYLNNIIPGR